jgi:chromosomal replication initiation ATPase DnaA
MSLLQHHAEYRAARAKWLEEQRKGVAEAAETVAATTGVPAKLILGTERIRPIAAARHELMVRLWAEGNSIAQIGRLLERDHTTVIYGLRKAMGREAYLDKVRPARPRKVAP